MDCVNIKTFYSPLSNRYSRGVSSSNLQQTYSYLEFYIDAKDLSAYSTPPNNLLQEEKNKDNRLYIGKCNYNTRKFCLKNIIFYTNKNRPQTLYESIAQKKLFDELGEQNSPDETDSMKIMSTTYEIDENCIQTLRQTIREFEPTTMDEESALYDMKLVLYWIDEKREIFSNIVESAANPLHFVIVTYH